MSDAKVAPPDGYCIKHCRYDDAPHFGPFKTLEEAEAWAKAHPEVRGIVIPMYLTVDWSRK